MPEIQKYEEAIDAKIRAELEFFTAMSVDIAHNPELSEHEYRTSKMLADALTARGWNVEYPYLGLPTAFNAVRKNGKGPVVAYMAEYDALPGVGHACGHNMNGVISLLGATALADAVLGDMPGEIRVVGTPAEETNGAKVEMAEKGIFDDADFAMMVHVDSGITHPLYRSMALVPLEFVFTGHAAHAASGPWNGRNALNGVQLLFHALDMLRQHVRPDTRIHGIITKGGDAPNVVPDLAKAEFYFRSPSRKYLESVLEQVYNCARGSALATATEVSWHVTDAIFHEVLPNAAAERAMSKVLGDLGIEYEDAPKNGGSTDVGNVSWRCPTMHLSLAITKEHAPHHTREFAAAAMNTENVRHGLLDGARALARMGMLVMTDANLRREMLRDFEESKTK